LFAAIIYVLALNKGGVAKLLAHPRLLILGEASYAIYILQVPLSYWTRQLIAVTPLQDFSAIAYPALYLPIIIGFSIGSFFWLEKPLRSRILAFFQQEAKGSTRLDKQGLPNQAVGYVKVAR
jgi:peptidoglycan/LPS O-acetylase OafA/YrhL